MSNQTARLSAFKIRAMILDNTSYRRMLKCSPRNRTKNNRLQWFEHVSIFVCCFQTFKIECFLLSIIYMCNVYAAKNPQRLQNKWLSFTVINRFRIKITSFNALRCPFAISFGSHSGGTSTIYLSQEPISSTNVIRQRNIAGHCKFKWCDFVKYILCTNQKKNSFVTRRNI